MGPSLKSLGKRGWNSLGRQGRSILRTLLSRPLRRVRSRRAKRPLRFSDISARRVVPVSPFPVIFRFRLYICCSLGSWDWKFNRFLGESDTNVSLRSIPVLIPSLVCSHPFRDNPSFCCSVAFTGSSFRSLADPFFPRSVGRDWVGPGLRRSGCRVRCSFGSHHGLVFCGIVMPNPK